MASVLQEKNLFLMLSKNFMFFEWTFEESEMKEDIVFISSKFKTGKGEYSFLEMKVNSNHVFLKLHNPKFVSGGYCMISIHDKSKSEVYNACKSTESFCNFTEVHLLWDFQRLPPFTKFPIIISCYAKSLNATLLKEPHHFSSPEHLYELSLDLKKILDQAINYDVVLNAQGENIKAHKAILQARSPVFNKMFHPNSSEFSENTVLISDIGAATMKRLVTFLYTGRMEKCDFDEAFELYYAADKYEVFPLREDCKAELLNNIIPDKACSLFALANRHNDEVFLKEVVQFICENFKAAVNSDAMDELNKDDMKLLMRMYAQVTKK